MTFQPGHTIVRRNVHRDGRISAVEAARVLSDTDDGLLTWTAAGSETMVRRTLSGDPVRKMSIAQRDDTPTVHHLEPWRDTSILVLTPPDSPFSVWWFFAPDFLGWYVNLESPARRWCCGADITDHALDIWVDPDRTWRWKDEDEFAERTGHPNYWTTDDAVGIRANAHQAIALIEAAAPPFDGRLTDFRPDPTWPPSRLVPHWDRPAR